MLWVVQMLCQVSAMHGLQGGVFRRSQDGVCTSRLGAYDKSPVRLGLLSGRIVLEPAVHRVGAVITSSGVRRGKPVRIPV